MFETVFATSPTTLPTTFSISPVSLSIPIYASIIPTYPYNAAILAANPASSAVLFVYATSNAIN